MMRILAVLLVVGLVAAAALHLAGRPPRALEEARIETAFHRAAIRAEERPALVDRLEAFVAEHDDLEARWLVGRTLLRMGEAERAIDVLFASPEISEDPASARRFGELLLRVLGFEDPEQLERPTLGAPQTLLALADGEVPLAVERLEETARESADQAVLSFFEALFASTTRATTELVAAGLRAGDLEHRTVVAALATMNETSYPEKAADLERLTEIVEGPMRMRVPLVWALACLALGRSEDSGAVAALDRMMVKLSRSSHPTRDPELGAVAAGLVAAGRWDAARDIEPLLSGPRANSPVRMWYGDAILNRIRRQDPAAPQYFRELWSSVRTHPLPFLAARIAQGLFLRELELPPSLDVQGVLTDLEAVPDRIPERTVAAAYRYRLGEEGSRDVLLGLIREQARAGWTKDDPITQTALAPSPLIVAPRALLLYEPSSAH